MVFGAKVGVTWWVSRGWFRSTLPIRDQGKVTLKGRRTGQRRREDRGLGERGSQERGRLPRIPGPGRERCPSGDGAAGEASKAREGEAEEGGANKPPHLIELYVVQKG